MPILNQFVTDPNRFQRVVGHLVEELGVGNFDLGLVSGDLRNYRTGTNLRQSGIGLRCDIGIVGGDEVGKRMNSQTNSLRFSFLYTLL